MQASSHGLGVALLVAGMLAPSQDCRAVLFKSTADPAYNTNAPSASLTNSGWQYEGLWIGYLATPIAPTFFLAAKHIGGDTNQVFDWNGFNYHIVAGYPDPSSDLQIWKVAETFPQYAPLYTNSDEVGKHCVVFGRGTQRGTALLISGVTNGWAWGTVDGLKRWGENDVGSIKTYTNGAGNQLRCPFDRNAGSNECHLSLYDSSGAVFIQDGSGTWRLAGIHYTVDGPFSNATYGLLSAALVDRGGFLEYNGVNALTNNINVSQDNPSGFYSTRVSARLGWINSIINFEPGSDLRITGIQKVSTDVQISFPTTVNRVYQIDWRSGVTGGAWTTLTNGIVGTGGVMTATDVGAATQPKRFYRLSLAL